MSELIKDIQAWFQATMKDYPYFLDMSFFVIAYFIAIYLVKLLEYAPIARKCFAFLPRSYTKVIQKTRLFKARNLILKSQVLTDSIEFWSVFLLIYFALSLIVKAFGGDIQLTYEVLVIVLVWNGLHWIFALSKEDILSHLLQYLLIFIFTLYYLEAYQPMVTLLDAVGIKIGEYRLTLFVVLEGFVVFIVLLYATLLLAKYIENKLYLVTTLKPSFRILLGKIIRIVLIASVVIITIESIGLDIGVLTIFTATLGLGLGLGLQKLLSNLVSGFILLGDSSIKPGDVIAIGETYGWVNKIGSRYVSIITRDGKEHLVPNEALITEKVENWSFTNENVRIRVPISVSYNSDVRQVIKLLLEAAEKTNRVLTKPAPNCLLRGFGDNSVDFELRIWINDPINGMGNIQSELLLNVWDTFQAHGIEIPYPQRDVHVKELPFKKED